MLKFSSLIIEAGMKPLLSNSYKGFNRVQVAGKYYDPKPPIDTSDWPEQRKLAPVEKQPYFGIIRPPKMPKMLRLLRGPEEVHNELLYKGYGIKALLGGRMTHAHFETIRTIINKKIDTERMFALWRVDAPWQPVSKRATGKRMGGGKGSIHHYTTPVKAERIIMEIGGDVHEFQAKKMLTAVANILPFASRVVSHQDLQDEKENEKWVQENNKNDYTMEYVILNNMGGCHKWLSKNDFKWFGKYK